MRLREKVSQALSTPWRLTLEWLWFSSVQAFKNFKSLWGERTGGHSMGERCEVFFLRVNEAAAAILE